MSSNPSEVTTAAPGWAAAHRDGAGKADHARAQSPLRPPRSAGEAAAAAAAHAIRVQSAPPQPATELTRTYDAIARTATA